MDGRRRWLCGALLGALAVEAAGAISADTVRAGEIDAGSAYASDAVLYYDFAAPMDGTGVVPDASGNARDGAAEGCVWRAGGRFAGGAAAFTGNASCILAHAVPDFTASPAYSASLWFLHDGRGDLGPQYGHKMLDRTAVGHDWHLGLRPEGHAGDAGSVVLSLHEDGRDLRLEDASRNWSDGAWHHVAVVRRDGRGELWIDGELRAETEGMFDVRTAAPLCIGNSRSADHHQRKGWSGLLDEVRLFDRALSADEIAHLHADGTTGRETGRVTFVAPVAIRGALTVSGPAVFADGIRVLRPRGDLSAGGYAGGAVSDAR